MVWPWLSMLASFTWKTQPWKGYLSLSWRAFILSGMFTSTGSIGDGSTGQKKFWLQSSAYASVIRQCGGAVVLSRGKYVHARIIKDGLEWLVFLRNLLIEMYGKCMSIADSWSLFNRTSSLNLFSWTMMIGAYEQSDCLVEAIELFKQMYKTGYQPDRVTFVIALKACSNLMSLEEGREIHYQILSLGLESDILVSTTLLHMYKRCGSFDDAKKIFEEMPIHNVVSCNAMISTYAQHGLGKEAFQVFDEMKSQSLVPDRITFIGLLHACGVIGALPAGKLYYSCILSFEIGIDVVIGTALLDMYSKCGSFLDAQGIFKKMHIRNVISWNALIAAYVQHGLERHAFQLLKGLQLEGLHPDNVTCIGIIDACSGFATLAEGKMIHSYIVCHGVKTYLTIWNGLLHMYNKCGSVDDACQIFCSMKERDLVSWNAMVMSYSQHGLQKEALWCFHALQTEGLEPDKITFIGALDACASLADLAEGKLAHSCISDRGYEADCYVGTAIINMYNKCGHLERALGVFQKITEQNVVSWTAIILALSNHGKANEALDFFLQMQETGVEPNTITVSTILYSCSHAGLMDEGCHVFVSVANNNDITSFCEHVECMTDLLSRAGWLDEGEDFISEAPFEANTVTLITMVSAYRNYSEVQ